MDTQNTPRVSVSIFGTSVYVFWTGVDGKYSLIRQIKIKLPEAIQ